MDSDRLDKWLTLGANVGVLVGIILLVVELGQNRDMMRAQTRNEIARASLDVLNLTATSEKLSDVVVRSNSGGELTPAERLMYVTRSESVFRHFENVHYQYRQGLYDEIEFQHHLFTMKSVISRNPGLGAYWCSNKEMFSAPFAEGMVFYPNTLLPLHIFEPRYKQLLQDAESKDIRFGIFFNHVINTEKIGALVKLESVIKRNPLGESDIIVKCYDIFSMGGKKISFPTSSFLKDIS